MTNTIQNKPLSAYKLFTLTTLALIAFAANSVLCRLALATLSIDPASFTLLRLISGALILLILCRLTQTQSSQRLFGSGDWLSSFALLVYAAGFSFAYISIPTGLGALLLFGSVQVTMMSSSLLKGERLNSLQWLGFFLAIAGLVWLLMPKQDASSTESIYVPSGWWLSASLMVLAGIAWGIYSIQGKKTKNATLATTDNFTRASLLALIVLIAYLALVGSVDVSKTNQQGVLLAIASGALTSGLGYAVWYAVLPHLRGTSAASLQLTVPVIAMFGGSIFLQESIGLTLIFASLLILGGIALVLKAKR